MKQAAAHATEGTANYAAFDDPSLAARIAAGDRGAFAHLMTACNQRLFRIARGLLPSDHEAEDVVQEAYVTAYEKIGGFRGEASLATWLTRIVINEARQRTRDRKPTVEVAHLDRESAATATVLPFPASIAGEEPQQGAARAELKRLLEEAIGTLPPAFRVVYVLREIEECSVEETAVALGLRVETVKTRLHRARRLLRAWLEHRVEGSLAEAFAFRGARCARTTARVLERIGTGALAD